MQDDLLTGEIGINNKLNPEDIFRTILYQMGMARYYKDEDSFISLGNWLDMLLTPYKDQWYQEEMKKARKVIEKEKKNVPPKQRVSFERDAEVRLANDNMQALINLMDRKGMLLAKSSHEQV